MAYNSELQMLREFAWYMFPQKTCYFCGSPLSGPIAKELFEQGELTFGHRRHRRIEVRISLHHVDENRENNKPENVVLSHTLCHKAHHNKIGTKLVDMTGPTYDENPT